MFFGPKKKKCYASCLFIYFLYICGMRTYLMPGEVGREIKNIGFVPAAEKFGLSPAQLNEFIEIHGMSRWVQIDISGMFPRQERKRRDPAKVQALLDQYSRQETAEKLGITVGTLNNYISQNNLTPPTRRPTVPPADELAPLLERHTVADIAVVYGVTPTTVSRWIASRGLKSKRTREMEALASYDIKAALLSGKTVFQIADETGLLPENILKKI